MGNNFGSSNDPFSLTNLKPISTPSSVSDASLAKSSPAVSTTTNTVSYRKEKLSSDSSAISDKSLKKKPSHSFSDFLTGSPLKLDKGEKKEKKEKKSGKFHLTSPLKTHKKESPSTDKKAKNSQHDQGSDELKMAAEMSLRADEDRRRKLQLQEEADLAYAIALSKAEAASLKQS